MQAYDGEPQLRPGRKDCCPPGLRGRDFRATRTGAVDEATQPERVCQMQLQRLGERLLERPEFIKRRTQLRQVVERSEVGALLGGVGDVRKRPEIARRQLLHVDAHCDRARHEGQGRKSVAV